MHYLLRFMCVVMAVMSLTSSAHAQFWGHGGDKGAMKEKREQMVQQIYGQLNLSEEQKKMLEENKSKHQTAKESLSKNMETVMQAMGEELKKKDLDMGKVNALHANLKDLRDQMSDERFNAVLEVRKILTQEQFVKFTELMEEQKEKRERNEEH